MLTTTSIKKNSGYGNLIIIDILNNKI